MQGALLNRCIALGSKSLYAENPRLSVGARRDGLNSRGEQRSILHEDAVFWVIGQEVITSLWGNPSQAVRAE